MDFIFRARFPVRNGGDLPQICDCKLEPPKLCCPTMTGFTIFPQPPPPPAPHHHSGLAVKTVVVIAVLSSLFLIATYYFLVTKVCARWRRMRAPVAGSEGSEDGDVDEIGDNPVNYVWYINTVGLEQSVINSITMCKYRKGDGLIEGTDCSVCLSEFKDNEDLRLLPKCSHAFHVGCIDTWLRSHVNCPLCRARVVSDPANGAAASEISHELSDNPNGVLRENVHGAGTLDENLVGESFMGELLRCDVERRERSLMDLEAVTAALTPRRDWRGPVLIELGENYRSGDFALEISDHELQSIRRSVSMDSSAASKLHMSLAVELLIEQDREKKEGLGECSRLESLGSFTKYGFNGNLTKIAGNRGKDSPFVSRLVAMKRSRSSSCSFFTSRYGQNRNSILPL